MADDGRIGISKRISGYVHSSNRSNFNQNLQTTSSITVAEGDSSELVVASSDEAINYQWTKDGVSIPQATAAVFKINSTKKSDEGICQAILTSGNTSKKSDAVKLTVLTSDDENQERKT